MPTVYILAGPNGTGKTTYYETAVAEGFIDQTLPFVNVDIITKSLPGGYKPENFVKAEAITRAILANHINSNNDFMIESNLSSQKDYDWIQAMITHGYDVVLFFLSTSTVKINIARVKNRVAEGGHYIAEPIIEHRYKMGLSYLKGKLQIFKKAYLIDNSGETALLAVELNAGLIVNEYPPLPHWVNEALYIVKRMKKSSKER